MCGDKARFNPIHSRLLQFDHLISLHWKSFLTLELQAVMNRAQAPPRPSNQTPHTAEPTEVCPKGWARGKSKDTGQRLSHGISCNVKCTGSAKG